MPPRLARSSVQVAAPKTARNKNRKRNLDAYAIASHSLPTKSTVRQNRLGEFLGDEPQQKRRRVEQESDEDDGEPEPSSTREKRPQSNGDIEEGSDSEGNEWTLGGLREDDEDSDLDSDDAFGESDEERFAGYSFRGSSSNKGKSRRSGKSASRAKDGDLDIDLDEQSEDDDDEEEGVDLATMLDDDDDESVSAAAAPGLVDDATSSEEDEGDVVSDSGSVLNGNRKAVEEERIARMRDRIDALDPTPTVAAKAKAPTTLTLEALLGEADQSTKKEIAKSSRKTKALSVPLPPRQQNRLDREVATKKAKEQLDRWRDTVIQNRRADFLSFPLQDPDRSEPLGKDRFIDREGPRNELEANIRSIMEESGMVSQDVEEDALMQSEGLVENKMPLEEVMRRRAELRQTRELLFREEIKAKRIAKIKSKAYRRVHRREKRRLLADEEPTEDDNVVADRKRAEARMHSKHKDSKWAKSMKATNRMVWDSSARDGVNEQAIRQEELRRRIAGDAAGSENDEALSEDDAEFSGDSGDEQTLAHLDRVGRQGAQDVANGLGGMKFMRAAEDRRRKQNEEEIVRLKRELDHEAGDSGDEDSAVNDQSLGRAIFGPSDKDVAKPIKQVQRSELQEGDSSEDEVEEDQVVVEAPVAAKPGNPRKSTGVRLDAHRSISRDDAQSISAWVDNPSGRKPVADDDALLKTTVGDDTPDDRSITPEDGVESAKTEAADTAGRTTVSMRSADNNDHDNESESDSEPSDPLVQPVHEKPSWKHRAFAGDNVKKAFDAEKADAIVSEDEKEVSGHLPGWGSWAGEGLSKSVRKANTRQRHNPLFKTKLPGVKAADRADVKLENVIISEKLDRKGKKYKADILPHGYERKDQYERALRVPMGPEWVTKETFQRNTRPRVVVKPGVVISAMERQLV